MQAGFSFRHNGSPEANNSVSPGWRASKIPWPPLTIDTPITRLTTAVSVMLISQVYPSPRASKNRWPGCNMIVCPLSPKATIRSPFGGKTAVLVGEESALDPCGIDVLTIGTGPDWVTLTGGELVLESRDMACGALQAASNKVSINATLIS